jgi:transcription antitermination factor NusG
MCVAVKRLRRQPHNSCVRLAGSPLKSQRGRQKRRACPAQYSGILRIDFRRVVTNSPRVSELVWFVAHTKPRREKKLSEFCDRQGFAVTLPQYKSVHRYRGKTVTFHKPLFPGYVFLELLPSQAATVRQNEHVANLLDVFDQATFARQLGEILAALEANLEVRLAPQIEAGQRVRIRSGPLQGIEGLVESRSGATTVYLRLDFINQAAAVRLSATELELS